MRLYDIHAHLADPRVLPRIDGILAEAARHGVAGILANAARVGEWDAVCALSGREPVYGALGLHPFFVEEWNENLPDRLRGLARRHPRIRAIGEVGLDFYPGREKREAQIEVLAAQLQVARELALPVIVHNRRSWDDFFGVLHDLGMVPLRGVCHCFNGSPELLRRVLDRGLMVSFCGPLTYPNARRLRQAARYAPLDAILTETDCPDLPAAPIRPGPSLPQHVRYVLETLAEVKEIPIDEVAERVGSNSRELLGECP